MDLGRVLFVFCKTCGRLQNKHHWHKEYYDEPVCAAVQTKLKVDLCKKESNEFLLLKQRDSQAVTEICHPVGLYFLWAFSNVK